MLFKGKTMCVAEDGMENFEKKRQRLIDKRYKENLEIFGHGITCPKCKYKFSVDEKDVFYLVGATDDDIKKMDEDGMFL